MHKPTLAAISLALCSSSVSATIISTQSATFGPINFSVSDTAGTFVDTLPSYGSDIRSLTYNKFDANTGVLTGVSTALSINAGGEVRLSASGTPNGASPSLQSSGFSTMSSDLSGSGVNATIFQINSPILTNGCRNPINGIGTKCFPAGVTNLSANAAMTKVYTTQNSTAPKTIATQRLNDYVGASTLASTLTVKNTVALTSGTGYVQHILNPTAVLTVKDLSGTQSLNYTYLNHANASFTGGLDTNALSHKFDESPFNFSLFNFGNADTTKLDYLGVNCSGDCDDFNLTLSALSDLGAGSHFDGFIDELYNDAFGTYTATYEFLFSDDTAVGASTTHKQNSLLLTVHGSVAAVPEPGTIALVLAGLGVIGIGTRRRKQQTVN